MSEIASSTDKKKVFNRRGIFFYIVVFCLLAAVLALLIDNRRLLGRGADLSKSWTSAQMREYANKLKASGLTDQAVKAFEEYLHFGDADKKTRSNIYYSIGEMFLSANQYENSLSYFYKAEIADPDTPLKKEIGMNVVNCLERMGKSLDAEYQLESRALLRQEEIQSKASGEVVAKIGKREIGMGEINQALEKLPPWLKEEFTRDEAKKLEFLKQYVSRELLYDKGVKTGLDKDSAIREEVENYKKDLIVQKILTKEVEEKVTAEDADVKNYYAARKEQYTEAAKLRFKHIVVKEQSEAERILDELKKGGDFAKLAKEKSIDSPTKDSGGEFSGWINEKSSIPEINDDGAFVKALFNVPNDSNPHILTSQRGVHVVQVIDAKESRIKPFEEVKNEVVREYTQEKKEKLTQNMLTEILQSKDVAVYENKFLKDNSQEPQAKSDKGNW